MEDVLYARCGKDDIAAIREDNTTWVWGGLYNIVNTTGYVSYYSDPIKVLENTELVTGGWFNHAALLSDGTVWTWGTNYPGNCGVADVTDVSAPQKVAENVIMVWTDNKSGNINCADITKLRRSRTSKVENTIIAKEDGSCWVCGLNVGDVERSLTHRDALL